MNKLIIFIVVTFLFLGVWSAIPYLWKASGGSFIHGNTAIYKGKQLFYASKDCSVATIGEDLHEISLICLIDGEAITRVWIDGVEV